MADRIQFALHWGKSLSAMCRIVSRLGEVEKVKLTKLLYLADRKHFLEYGTPITGDSLVAMDFGPVPSRCLDALDGDTPECGYVLERLHRDDNTFTLREGAATSHDALSETESSVLEEVLAEYGKMSWRSLVEETHSLPEFEEVYERGTSRPIRFERILKASKSKRHWRHNRPVVSKATAAAMMPTLRPEPDL